MKTATTLQAKIYRAIKRNPDFIQDAKAFVLFIIALFFILNI